MISFLLCEHCVRSLAVHLQQKTEHSALLIQKLKGMARNLYDDSYEEYDDYECESYDDGGYEWTEEDSWDALTDGMYGDMPRNPMEYDAMMDALGF